MAREYNADAILLFLRVARRCRRERLEEIALDTTCRTGEYACTLCAEGDVTACVFLDSGYRVKGHIKLREGKSGDVDSFSGEIIAEAEKRGADRVMLCASHRITPEEILSFNLMYRALLNAGIAMVDLFEIAGDSYYSVLSDFSSCIYPSREE